MTSTSPCSTELKSSSSCHDTSRIIENFHDTHPVRYGSHTFLLYGHDKENPPLNKIKLFAYQNLVRKWVKAYP